VKPIEQRKNILKQNQTTNQYVLDIKELLKGLTFKDVVFSGYSPQGEGKREISKQSKETINENQYEIINA
jgi:hypothetical protein